MSNYFGAMPNLYPTGNDTGAAGANNRALYRYQQASGTSFTGTVSFGTDTTVRNILYKPFATGTTAPNQTASPIGVAGKDIGFNPASTLTDNYVVLEKVLNSYTGVALNCLKPVVVASPWSGFGNAFQFTGGNASGGASANEYGHVNFGGGYGFGADNHAFCLDVRFKMERTGFEEVIAGWARDFTDNAQGSILIRLLGGNTLQVEWYDGGSLVTINGSTVLALNSLNVVRLSYDGTKMRLHLNGALEASGTHTLRAPTTLAEFVVAKCANAGYGSNQGDPFGGTIDSVRISNTARGMTDASYTVETAPFTVDGNTVLLCDFEALVAERRILKSGSAFLFNGFLTASQVDALSTTYGIVMNVYRRTAAGVLTYLTGGGSALIAAPSTLTNVQLLTSATSSDVVFNNGDCIHFEFWISGRGGGSTGLLSQDITFTTGYPTQVPTDHGACSINSSGGANPIFRVLFDQAPAGSISSSATIRAVLSKNFTGGMTPSGTLKRVPLKFLAGSVTPINAVLKLVIKAVKTSVTTPAGALKKTPNKYFTSSTASSATVVRLPIKRVGGTIGPVGALVKLAIKRLAGTVSSSGTNKNTVVKHFTGFLYGPAGSGGAIRKIITYIFDD